MSDTPEKQTIYIDVEDEITGIIDKLRRSEAKVVALVLPKRASALQSTVNLKLLKRKAEDAKKNIVLITSDPGLLPMAGAVGLHVAKSLQSKPAIPSAPEKADHAVTVDSDEDSDEEKLDRHKSIGELAAAGAGVDEIIDVDNVAEAVGKGIKSAKKSASKYAKKLKVPNFDSFRTKLLTGGGALILIITLWVLAAVIFPKAKVVITTDTSSFGVDVTIDARTDIKDVDTAKLIVPATARSLKKTDSAKVATSGKRNDGTKAGGTITAINCTDNTVNLPAGTVFSNGGLSFTTNVAVGVAPSNFTSPASGGACKNDGKADVAVTAANPGAQYNLAAGQPFTSSAGSKISGYNNAAMSGGTDKITQIVSQSDIDSAKQQVLDKLNNDSNTTLTNQFKADNSVALTDTFGAADVQVAPDTAANQPAAEVTVTVNVTYTELGVKQDDIKKIITADVSKHIDAKTQTVQDTGVDNATLQVTDKPSAAEVKARLQSNAVIGPQIDQTALKKQIKGKKKGDTQAIIMSRPGVKDVNISFSPFWVNTIPSKVDITIKKQ